MKFQFVKILKQKSGIAIMSVMLFFIVITILLGALSFTSMGNAQLSGTNSNSMAAFYAAEAGTNSFIGEVKELQSNRSLSLVDFVYRMSEIIAKYDNDSFLLSTNGGSDVMYSTRLEYNHDPLNRRYVFTVFSTGSVQDYQRSISTLVEVEYGRTAENDANFQLRHAILVQNSITINQGASATIQGLDNGSTSIATLSLNNGSISSANQSTLNGSIELLKAAPANNQIVTGSSFSSNTRTRNLITTGEATEGEIRVTYPRIEFNVIRDIVLEYESSATRVLNDFSNFVKIDTDGKFLDGGIFIVNNLDFSSSANSRLRGNIEVRDDTFIVVENALTIGNVSFSGEGTLTIFVKQARNNFITGTNNVDFGHINEQNLIIYVDNNLNNLDVYHVTFNNGTTIRANIMFSNSRVEFLQGSSLIGSIFTGATDIIGKNANSTFYAISVAQNASISDSGGRALLVAPNGTVYFFNNSSIRGAVISRNVNLGNGVTITFDPSVSLKIPFEITSPIQLPPSDNFGINRLIIHRTTEN